ncbi:beta-ketoacyl synthase N-terminal-like domain-containing protein [Comamonas sp. GB3 AK4-5]|uniref:beta-ketoacyl synthase N-terminal-like domain-containing protein n=1 Tax=Comamonas sp. GB3 AK4-5 TaxID=3231487 RepID=UPI00351EA675
MSKHDTSEELHWSETVLSAAVHERFELIAATLPNKLAVKTLHGSVSYGELNQLANRIASRLLRCGERRLRDLPVAILIPQGINMIAAALGILKAGGFYVPLDPSVPVDRTEHMLRDSEAQLFVVDGTLSSQSRARLTEAAALIDIDELGDDLDEVNPAVGVKGDDLACLLYTSGTTGTPKGVMQSHRQLMHNVWVHSKSFEISANDKQSLLYPCNVYGSIRDTFNALLNGASLHVLSVKSEELALLPDWLRSEEISIYCSVATIFRQLGRWLDEKIRFPDLRIIKLGGEVVYAQDIDLYKRCTSDQCRLSCGLASTETGAVTQYFINKSTFLSSNVALMGRPVEDVEILLLDDAGSLVADGEVGEIVIKSAYLSPGYWRKAALSAERFSSEHRSDHGRLFRMGDLAQKLPDGSFVHRGRKDLQVKIRGNRIEIPEVEQSILRTGATQEVVVVAKPDATEQLVLVAYVEWTQAWAGDASDLRRMLEEKIPATMIPSHIVVMEKIPLLPNGKKDRNALAALKLPALSNEHEEQAPVDAVEDICSRALGVRPLPRKINFFELGADSLKLVSLYRMLVKELKVNLQLVDIFQHPTVESLSGHILTKAASKPAVRLRQEMAQPLLPEVRKRPESQRSPIAIVGMAGRFPGGRELPEFWKDLVHGVEMLSPVDVETLQRQGIAVEAIRDSDRVLVTSLLHDIEYFDNEFFRMTPREAELMDPQIRVLLECSVEAFEDAGELPSQTPQTAVFVSVGKSDYYLNNVRARDDLIAQIGDRRALLFNDRTYAASFLSYKLDLQGPSMHIDTACSSSLVAVHNAVRSLQAGDCKQALAGGVRVIVPHGHGYARGEGGIESSNGQCRPFDRNASGTVFGSGAGVVLLKRLEDALSEGNHIYGVIRGSAVGNDGTEKVGFTAPAVAGQIATIERAIHDAGVAPSDIHYIEAHGTATVVGDPIEITALNHVFSNYPSGARCPIGSIKGNVGHLSTASGVVGLMKVALALKHGILPASINYESPNLHIPFHQGPFYVNTKSVPWKDCTGSRLAGVSAFGLGGTNAHVVLEHHQAIPMRGSATDSDGAEIFVLSGQTPRALDAYVAKIASFLRAQPLIPLRDIALTLACGRVHHPYAATFVASTTSTLLEEMDDFLASKLSRVARMQPKVAFLFPGQGTQHIGMMRDLYFNVPSFSECVDRCCEILDPLLQEDVLRIVFPHPGDEAVAEEALKQTRISQPVLFMFEYALAQLWIRWGVSPAACMGHSLGEYVAACIAGVFSLESALDLVAARGRLMQAVSPGTMLAATCSVQQLDDALTKTGCSLAAINFTMQQVVSGDFDQIDRCQVELEKEGIRCVRVNTSHAFHSHMMDGVLDEFRRCFDGIEMAPPSLPIVSNLTGDWLSAHEATNPDYWVRHLRQTVRFHDGVERLGSMKNLVLIEVGPGQVLKNFVEASSGMVPTKVISSCRHQKSPISDDTAFKQALGRAWELGVGVDWHRYYGGGNGHKISLPTYPFQRKRFWIDPLLESATSAGSNGSDSSQPADEQISTVPMDIDSFICGVSGIWERLLGVEGVQQGDNFFSLGGDSMVLMQMQRLISKEMGISLDIGQLYRNATVLGIAHDLVRCSGTLSTRAPQVSDASPTRRTSAQTSHAENLEQDVATLWEKVQNV